jgi:hypothetical protein
MNTQTQVARAIQHHRYESSCPPDRHHERRPLGVRILLWIVSLWSRRREFPPAPPNSRPRRHSALSPG